VQAPPIRRWLADAAGRIDAALGPARVAQVVLPPQVPNPGREGEFCAVVLDDGSTGLAFTLLDGTLATLHARRAAGRDAPGSLARERIEGYASGGAVERTLGLATVNALARRLFDRAGFVADDAADSFGSLALAAGDRLGMIGQFGSLIAQARALGVPVVVLELRADLVREAPGLSVTLDPGRLAGCNKIVATSAVLLNDTFERVCALWRHADAVAIVGPSAGGPPDAFFAGGVGTVGTAWVTEPEAFARRVAAGEPWGTSARKVTLVPQRYPGLDALLGRAR
jgi:uncharacterized protein (DUF4213/DUF364 family)